MKRCGRCILPETVPGISFDAEGVCNFCRSYRKEEYYPVEELESLIASTKARKEKYDCIVPLSGGRDSTYVLYWAKAVKDLKVLAVNYNNEFRVDQAIVNMSRACGKLGVDFVSIRSARDIVSKCVKYSILSAVEFGQYGLCNACEYGYKSTVYRSAEKYHVPLILWGESQFEKTADMGINTQSERYRLKIFLKLTNMDYFIFEYLLFLQRCEFPVQNNSIYKKGNPVLLSKDTTEIRLFDYLPWDRQKIKDIIIKELGWEKPADSVSTWRTDCDIHSLGNYISYKLIGCTKDCLGYCKMINGGQISREDALRQEEEAINNIEHNIETLLRDKIGLSSKTVDEIISYTKN